MLPSQTVHHSQISRRDLLLAGGGIVLLTGCEGMDFSAAGEGTGVQIIGAVVVMARYRASAQQRAIAEKQAHEIIVAAAKPEYVKRRAAIQKESQKKIATIEREHSKHPVSGELGGRPSDLALPGAAIPLNAGESGVTGSSLSSTLATQERRKQEEIARVKAEADARIASLDTVMKPSGTAAPSARIFPSARDAESLKAVATAHVPSVILVEVPPQGIAAERKGKSLAMLVNTRTQNVVSGDVLVLDRVPTPGKDVKIDGIRARVMR